MNNSQILKSYDNLNSAFKYKFKNLFNQLTTIVVINILKTKFPFVFMHKINYLFVVKLLIKVYVYNK
jgi:hypothetical protein